MQDTYTDQEFMALLKRAPEQAIEWLFRAHFTYLTRVVYKVLLDEGVAEDLAQDVFFEVWKRRETLYFTGSVRAYLRLAVLNKTLNYIRDKRLLTKELPEYGLPAYETGIQKQLEADELQERIDGAINQLPERCRIIFILSRFDDMTYKEIATELGISVKTVENQISKALRLIREQLDKEK